MNCEYPAKTWNLPGTGCDGALSALAVAGLGAAVVTPAGQLLGANTLIRAPFLRTCRGLALAEPRLHQEFQRAIAGSVPLALPVADLAEPLVIHIRPGWDMPDAPGQVLVIAKYVSIGTTAPDAALLERLFGLTTAEARLAANLAAHRTLKQSARDARIAITTARSYLDRVFAKTGMRRQTDLVSLLRSAWF